MPRKSRSKKAPFTEIYSGALKSENYGTVHPSIYTSPQFVALPLAVKHFYTCCRMQLYVGRQSLHQHGKEEGKAYDDEKYFAFPAEQQKKYGFDHSNASRYFKKLEDAGFIDIVEKNGHRHKLNVYAFSKRWKERAP